MSFSIERVEGNTLSQATSPAAVYKGSMNVGDESIMLQPVSEVFKNEKEQRLADYVNAMEKKRFGANSQAREIRDTQTLLLTDESDKVLHSLTDFKISSSQFRKVNSAGGLQRKGMSKEMRSLAAKEFAQLKVRVLDV
jgi:hypothetical protein